jgi:uncharacterized protein (TIGR00251 family)
MTAKDAIDELFDVVQPPSEGDDASAVVLLRVHVQPGAGRTAVTGRYGDAVKLKVAAAPEGGRANEAVVTLLASTLGVDRGSIELSSGATSRAKRFTIRGVDLADLRRLLGEALAGPGSGNAGGRGGVR